MIDWTEIIVKICYIVITGVIVPLAVNLYKSKVSKDKREQIDYWTDKAVRWAKQELWDKSNEEKKTKVMQFVTDKLAELKIDLSAQELSLIIEAIYGQIKDELAKPETTK